MKLSTWLASLSPDTLAPYATAYVVSQVYHPLFMSSLLSATEKVLVSSFMRLDLKEQVPEVEHKLSISFLGQQQLYWLGSLETLSAQQRLRVTKYLSEYTGPHVVWCHTKEAVSPTEKTLVLTLPEVVDYQEFAKIASFIYSSLSQQRCSLFRPIFKERKTVSLDIACVIMQYASVLSVQQIPEFISEWVDRVFAPDHSLFTLSTLYFAKDTQGFLSLWGSIKNAYSVHFWISYWSEQLFRAHQYIGAKEAKDIVAAKKYAYRLPFSFIQRDWKKYTTHELRTAHQELYGLDFKLKQGGDERFLDLWIHQSLRS